ncbi:hypothetical protein [Vibrio cholerae]|uniref:hypothetical protein n=1 Tax=Vibrio cholerae TaxID=666 RepID=UPI0028D99B1A|nr:hypothetical protein [Vibrio cholerae]ELJ8693668.1 hypothetical protein [Vibrio cholerae]
MKNSISKKITIAAAISSSFIVCTPITAAENISDTVISSAESSSREKRSALWLVGTFVKRPTTLAFQPMKTHFSNRLLNLLTLGLYGTANVAEGIIDAEKGVSILNSLIATEASVFTQLTDISAAVGEETAGDAVLHPINLSITETMALVEDSQLYPVSSYSGTVMREALIDMEKEFSQELKAAIARGEIQRTAWSFFPEGLQAKNVVQNEVRALSGKWARNFEVGEYDPINKKVDVRIFHRGTKEVVEGHEKHIFNVAKRLHRTGNFRVIDYDKYAGEALEDSVLETEAKTAFSNTVPGDVITYENQNYIVTSSEHNGMRKLANANGTRLRAGQNGHLVLGNLNGKAVPVYEEGGTFRLYDQAGKHPILIRSTGAEFQSIAETLDINNMSAPTRGFNTAPPQNIVNISGGDENCFYVTVAVLLNFSTTADLAAQTGIPEFCLADEQKIKDLFKAAGQEAEIREYHSKFALEEAMKTLPEKSTAGVAFRRPKRIVNGLLEDENGHMFLGYRDVGKIKYFDFQKNPIGQNFSAWNYSIPADAYQFLLFTPK